MTLHKKRKDMDYFPQGGIGMDDLNSQGRIEYR